MTNLEKATRYILQALHPECETWEEVEEKYSVCEYDESERLSEKEKDEYFERNKFYLKPDIHLAEVLQAIYNNAQKECSKYDGEGACDCWHNMFILSSRSITEELWKNLDKNATPIPLHKQKPEVWEAIVRIFES